MSWSAGSLISVREQFALAALAQREPFVEVCRRFQIGRSTGYKWLKRYRQSGRSGLQNRSRRPRHCPRRMSLRWVQALRQLRRRYRRWGPRKLRAHLRELHPRVHLPSVRTLARWLKRLGLVSGKRRHQRRGPALATGSAAVARRPNDVWTIDFKGWFPLGDGTRADALTVRDLKSRFVLDVRLLPGQTQAPTQRALLRVFRRYGLPRVIRVDNGPPFGGGGPRGLSRLAVWWRKLGIKVEFGRPAHPEDNAAHEQMHGVYQAEVASSPAVNRAAQQRRSDRWRARYNYLRPHEALKLRPPAREYHHSVRPLPQKLPGWTYPNSWIQRRINRYGRLYWHGRLRLIGEAFSGEIVGLYSPRAGVWKVFFGRDLLGLLYLNDRSNSIRPAYLTTH